MKNNLRNTDQIGRIVGEYYNNEARVVDAMKKNQKPIELIAW